MKLGSAAFLSSLAVIALSACSAKIRLVDEQSTATGSDGLGGNNLGGFPQGAANSSSSSNSSNSSNSSSSSSSSATTSGAGGAETVEQLCQNSCDDGCVYFGADCVGGCVGTQLSADCAEPYLGYLQCLAQCEPFELCKDAFEPFHECVNPYQCDQGSDFFAEGDFCSNTTACNDNHSASMNCTQNQYTLVEECECFFDGEFKGTCANAANTQCSLLFPCCQPLWRP